MIIRNKWKNIQMFQAINQLGVNLPKDFFIAVHLSMDPSDTTWFVPKLLAQLAMRRASHM